MRVYLVLILIVLFLIMILSRGISKKIRLWFSIFIASIILVVLLYEYSSSKEQKKLLILTSAFRQDKNLICQGHEVNSSSFILEVGTSSLIAKSNNTNLKGVIFPIKECKVQD